jgi:hypothetical protein
MKLLLILILMSSYCFAEVKEFSLNKGDFELSNGSGDITITGTKSNKVKIDYSKIKWSSECHLDITKNGDKIIVKVTEDSSINSESECMVNFNILMPQKLKNRIVNGSGNIALNNLKGDINFVIGSGSVAINSSIVSSVDGKSGSGNISLTGQFDNLRKF